MSIPLLILSLVLAMAPPAQTPSVTRPAAEAEPVTVLAPLELIGGRPVVWLKVNGAGPFRFLLDPLATTTVLDAALVQELRLRRPEVPKDQPAAPYGIELQVGTLAMPGVSAEAIDMATLVPEFSTATRPRGVMGGEAWTGRLLTLDYPAWKMALTLGTLPAPDGSSIFSLDPATVREGVPISLAGRRLTCALDLLFVGGLVVPEAMAAGLPLVKGPVAIQTLPTRSGPIVVSEAQLAGDLDLLSQPMARPGLLFSRQVRVPTLGTAWLGQFVVIVDGANRRARLVRRAS